jgi:hypothetical protein
MRFPVAIFCIRFCRWPFFWTYRGEQERKGLKIVLPFSVHALTLLLPEIPQLCPEYKKALYISREPFYICLPFLKEQDVICEID